MSQLEAETQALRAEVQWSARASGSPAGGRGDADRHGGRTGRSARSAADPRLAKATISPWTSFAGR